MISPSDSASALTRDKASVSEKKKFGPSDIKIDSKYILDSHKALKKLVDLTKDECATQMVGRLKELIHKFLRGSPPGFSLEDLPSIIEAVEFFSRNQSVVPEFTKFVKSIMCFAREPPKLERTSDVLHSKEAMVDYFTLFGELLATFEDECFQLELLECLDCLLVRRKLVDLTCVKLSFCHETMEASQLPQVVVSLMETVSNKLYVHYLELTLQMLLVSWKAGYTMLQSNLLDFVLWRLEPFVVEEESEEFVDDEVQVRERYNLLDKSTYLIWGLLAIVPKSDFHFPCPGERAMRSFRSAFQREALLKTSKAVNARNNLAGILVKLCAVFGESLPVVQTGLAVDVAALAVATEVKAKAIWVAELKLGTSKEDYVFKKMMLLCCCVLVKNKDAIEPFRCQNVIEGTLRMIGPKMRVPWSPSQFVVLFFAALRTLAQLVPQLPVEYVKGGGNAKLLSTIKWLMEKHLDEGALLEALKTFYVTATCENSQCIVEDIKAQNGIRFLLDLCDYLLDVDCMKLQHQEKLTRVFVVLERLLRNEETLQKTFGESCASVSLKLLNRILTNSQNDSKWDPMLLIGFGGFLWEAVAWCQSTLQLFTQKGGVFLLLDLVESSCFPLQMFFLGILVDMTDGGETISHLLTWRGKDGCGVLSMMIGVWRKEEFITKVRRTKQGFIQDVDAPLMTEEQWYFTHQVRGAHIYSPSIAEMVGSARPKVHALYQFLHRRYASLTELGESSYHLQLKTVASSHRVYIPLVEHFLAMKMGEIWSEVMRDANFSGILPVSFDGELICTLLDEKNKWALRIKTMQEEMTLCQGSEDAAEEKKFYESLKLCHVCDALGALNELEFVARTSFQKFQRQKKEKQIKEVGNSLSNLPFLNDVNCHRTFLTQTNITYMHSDYFWMSSEKELQMCSDILPVSEASEGDGVYFDEYIDTNLDLPPEIKCDQNY